MRYCVECGTAQSLTWKFCPHCGQGRVTYDLPSGSKKSVEWFDLEPELAWADSPDVTVTNDDVPTVRQYRPENVGENRRKIRAEEKRHNKYENRRMREQRKLDKRVRKQKPVEKRASTAVQDAPKTHVTSTVPTAGTRDGHPGKPATPKRRGRAFFLGALLISGLLTGAWFGGRAIAAHDSYRRSVEMSKLLAAIEASEQVMTSWEEKTAVATGNGNTFDDASIAAVERIAAEHLTRLEDLRASFTDDGGLGIPVWHGAIRAARDQYIAHHSVWVRYLKAVSRDARELGNPNIIARIDDTFERACLTMWQIEDQPRFPNRSAANRDRVAEICGEANTLRPV